MDEVADLPEPKDRTKLIWGIVVGVFAIMILAIWWSGRINPNKSVVRLKHILVAYNSNDPADRARALELIQELRERIVNGEDFGAIAEEYSNDPGSSSRGGDLGYIFKGSLVTEMEKFAWESPVGELSPVIQSSLGYHIAIVTDRHLSDLDRLKMEDEREWQDRLSGDEAPQSEGAGEQ